MAIKQTSQPALSETNNAPPIPSFYLFILIALFALFFSVLAVRQHQAFLTNGLDIGNVDQALWNTAHGRFMQFTLMAPVQSRLALHVEPILLFFVPFYWMGVGSPELLLIVQAFVVAIGGWPLYKIAVNIFYTDIKSPLRLRSPAPLLVFPVAYLLLPTLQSAVLFDFHAVTLAPTFLLFSFLALEQRNNRMFLLFAVLAMACKEDMPLVVLMLGVYAALAHHRWRVAGVTVGLSVIWFVGALFVIQPMFATEGNIQLDRYAWLGESPVDILQTLVSQPGLVFDHLWRQADLPRYLAALFFPTAFLALFSPLTLLPMLPTLAVNLLSDNPFTWRLEDFHYGAPLAPFLFISAIYGVRQLGVWGGQVGKKVTQRTERSAAGQNSNYPHLFLAGLILLLFGFTAVYHYYRGFTSVARPYLWPQVSAHHQTLNAALKNIPPDSALFAQSNLAPHLSRRQVIYADFDYFTNPDFPAAEAVKDIVLDITVLENIGGLHQFLRQTLLENDDYQLVTAQDGILHWQLSAGQASPRQPYVLLPDSFYTFVRPGFSLDYPLQVDFGEMMRLYGYTLSFNRQEEVQVTVDLALLQPLHNVQPVLYLLDATGQPVGATTDLQPALVWYPVALWAEGEAVRVTFNTLPWYTRDTKKYRLALGVINGADVWNVAGRHRPAIAPDTPFAVRTPATGTLVELAQIEQVWQIPEGGPQVRQFTRPAAPNSIAANFDNQIELFGYDTPDFSQETPSLSVTLFWQAVAPPESLVRFVQVVGPDGHLYGQQDSAPDRGQYPTHRWQSEEVVVETVIVSLQPQRPPGNYTLHVGLYHPASGQRLPLLSGGDHVEIDLPQQPRKSP